MTDDCYSRLFELVDRLHTLARAYSALSWFSECSAEVPADRVGWVMMPLDRAMDALQADFRLLLGDVLQEARRSPKLHD